MAISTNANQELLRKNLLQVVRTYDKSPQRTYWSRMIGRTVGSDQLFEVINQVQGLGLPQVVSEYGAVPQSDVSAIYRKQYNYQTRKLKMVMSDETFINDQYGVFKNAATELMASFVQAKEIAAAIYLNGCTTSALISTPAGQPLASTAHPLETGTDSNTFAVQQTLGVQSLSDASAALFAQKAHRANMLKIQPGPYVLEVSMRNNMLAKQIVDSEFLATTNNNDINSLAKNSDGNISGFLSNPFFTNPEWWCLRAASPELNPRIFINRFSMKPTDVIYDNDNDSWSTLGKEGYLFDVVDYRGAFYSTPS